MLKLSGGHFPLQVAGEMRFVRAIIREPDGFIFAFVVVPFVGTDLAAVLFAVLHGTLTVLRAHAPGLWTQRSRMLRAESMVAW